MDAIVTEAIRAGKIIAEYLYKEPRESGVVGMDDTTKISVDGKEYYVHVTAYWENTNHFDIRVEGVGFEYSTAKCCNEF